MNEPKPRPAAAAAAAQRARTRGVGRQRKAYDIDDDKYRQLLLLAAVLREEKVTASDLVNEALELLLTKYADRMP